MEMPIPGPFAALICSPLESRAGGAGSGQEPGSGVATQPCRTWRMGAAPITEHQHLPAGPRWEVAGRALPGRALWLFHPLIKAPGHKPGLQEPISLVPVQPRPARRGIEATAPSGAAPFAFLPFPLPKHTSLIKAAYLEALNPPACKGGGKQSMWRPIS